MTLCFVALGANLGDPLATIRLALQRLQAHAAISNLICSPIYRTTPVSPIPQPHFLNAVCRFECTLSLHALFSLLEQIERELGKTAKPKQAPRVIDLDLLFYGSVQFDSPTLTVPHPRWKERLFVLKPLADVTDDFDVQLLLKNFSNPNKEEVVCIANG